MGIEPLSAYPHILEAIKATWGYPECGNYLDRLVLQERGEQRQGLSVHALEVLIIFQELHRFLYSQQQPVIKKNDVWGR
jgi:hypothetical protein